MRFCVLEDGLKPGSDVGKVLGDDDLQFTGVNFELDIALHRQEFAVDDAAHVMPPLWKMQLGTFDRHRRNRRVFLQPAAHNIDRKTRDARGARQPRKTPTGRE